MSNKNISQFKNWNIYNFICSVMKFVRIDIQRGWINGRPVLINGDVWCPMCEAWHVNNSLCQQP
jgi:hypothetical protein